MRRLAATALLALTLTGVGCAASPAGGPEPRDSSAAVDDVATDGAVDAAVDVENFAFGPETLDVNVGATITWTNQDQFAHTVTSGEPGSPTEDFDGDLGEVASNDNAGTTFTTTLAEAGTYSYFCRLHPNMRGTVVVG